MSIRAARGAILAALLSVTCAPYSADCHDADLFCDLRASILLTGLLTQVEAVIAVTGGGTVWRSKDGGLSYEQVGISEHAGSQLFAAAISPRGEVLIGGLRGANAYVSYSPDLGQTWQGVTGLEASTGQVQGIAYNPNSGRWVISGNAGLLAWYSDNGRNWINAPVAGTVGNLAKVVYTANAFHLTASSGAQQGIYRAANGSSFVYSGAIVQSFRSIEGNGGSGLAAVGNGSVGAFSIDGGTSWVAGSTPPLVLCTDILFDGARFLTSCNDGSIQQSVDGNAWAIVATPFVATPTLEWTGSRYLLTEVNAGTTNLFSTTNPAAPGAPRATFAGFLQHIDYQLALIPVSSL